MRRPSLWPWWLQALAVYGATRLWSTAIFLLAAAGQPASYWAAARPDYGTFVGVFWDGSWYRAIAEDGYPPVLPRDAQGAVQQNAWAFFPLFPMLVRLLATLTGASWPLLAPTTALVLGAAAALVLDRLVQGQVDRRLGAGAATTTDHIAAGSSPPRDRLPRDRLPRDRRPRDRLPRDRLPRDRRPRGRLPALGTVLLVGIFPASPVLQAAYAESLALLLVASALLLLVRRRYLAAVPVVVALGFTRAVALPLAAVVVVHLLVRLRARRSRAEPLAGGDVARLGVLALAAVAAGVAWPLVVARATGVPDAYVLTQAAWRGSFSSAPVVPWLQMAQYLMGPVGLVVLVAVLGGLFALALSRPARAAGPEVQAWGVAYLGYLVAVAFPQSSVIRFLVLAFPLALAVAVLARTGWRLLGVAAVLAASQVGWVIWLWQVTAATSWPP